MEGATRKRAPRDEGRRPAAIEGVRMGYVTCVVPFAFGAAVSLILAVIALGNELHLAYVVGVRATAAVVVVPVLLGALGGMVVVVRERMRRRRSDHVAED